MKNIYINLQSRYFLQYAEIIVPKYAAFKLNIVVLSHFQLAREQH